MTYYCTLDEAKDELNASGTIGDDTLLRRIRQASRRADSIMNPRLARPYFAPWIEQREYPVLDYAVSSLYNTLELDHWLLAFTAVTLAGTDITATTQQHPSLARSFKRLQRTASGYRWYDYDNNTDLLPVFVAVTGTWGYHGDYNNAWVKVDDLTATLNATDVTSTMTVADVDGDDPFGYANRISPGALLKIGTEFCEVTGGINTSTNVATIRRAVNGSTIATHAIGDDVYRWYAEESIRRVIARQAGLMYARIGAYQQETLDGVGVITYPTDLLTELKDILTEYTYG